MLHDRRAKIVQMISSDRMLKVSDLTELFKVSIETIRRDLEYLEQKGYLNRVYGGAVAKSMYGMEPDYSMREVKHFAEKTAIGEAASNLIEDGDTIVIDVGTTTLEFAKWLKGKKKVTVITNAIQIALELVQDKDIRVMMMGGELRGGEYSTSGFLAEDAMKMFNVDKVVLGIGGITVKGGVTDYNIEEANLRRLMVKRTGMVIGLADFSKFGVTALNHICSANRLHTLVTDQNTPPKYLAEFRNLGINVVVCNSSNEY